MRLGKRVGRLERPRAGDGPPLALWRVTEEVAAERGLDPAEVWAEAGVVWREAAKAGALGSTEDLERVLAADGRAAWRG